MSKISIKLFFRCSFYFHVLSYVSFTLCTESRKKHDRTRRSLLSSVVCETHKKVIFLFFNFQRCKQVSVGGGGFILIF